jgi:hypothetical protein
MQLLRIALTWHRHWQRAAPEIEWVQHVLRTCDAACAFLFLSYFLRARGGAFGEGHVADQGSLETLRLGELGSHKRELAAQLVWVSSAANA